MNVDDINFKPDILFTDILLKEYYQTPFVQLPEPLEK